MTLDREYEKRLIAQQIALKNRMLSAMNRSVDDISVYLSRYSKKFPDDYAKRITYINRMNIKRQIMAQMKQLRREVEVLSTDGVKSAWMLATKKNNLITKQFITGIQIPVGLAKAMLGNNERALQNYLKNASKIAESVKGYTGLYQEQIENYLSSGIIQGKGAKEIATDLKKIAKDPQSEFKAMQKANPDVKIPFPKPGAGVYKSITRNLQRITRTEINTAFRLSDFEKRQNMPFVVGIQVHLSGAHPKYDICDAMSGSYPKDFVFTGWHPHCLCYSTSVLCSRSEFKSWRDSGMKNEVVKSQNIVTKIPNVAKSYMDKTKDKYKSQYWFRDNFNERGKFVSAKERLLKNPDGVKLPGSKYKINNGDLSDYVNK